MHQISIPQSLYLTPMPTCANEDDRADDALYQDWLGRVQDPSHPILLSTVAKPCVGEFLVFVFSAFQQQLVMALPRTVRKNDPFPQHEGEPYIKALPLEELTVSQHVMVDSYVALPDKLTRFVASQYTANKWETLHASFFPVSLEDCHLHPGWTEPHMTYLDLWRGLLERVQQLPNSEEIPALLVSASKMFIGSFKILPDHVSKVYDALRAKEPCLDAIPIWDERAFQKAATSDPKTFSPRYMTINSGHRVASRIRLAYTMTAPSQKRYMGHWQRGIEIKQTHPNWAILYPSPPPFEYPWLKENHHLLISERGFMMWKEGVPEERFIPEGKTRGIGHNWWNLEHSVVNCSVCRTWSRLNPPVLDRTDQSWSNFSEFDRGDYPWGYFACE